MRTKRGPVCSQSRLWTSLFGVLLVLSGSEALAWTRPAHMVSAAIAYDQLVAQDPQIVAAIMDLMSHHPDPGPFQVAIGRATGAERTQRIFLEMARWPDDIRGGFQDHPTWHYAFRPYVDPRNPPPRKPPDVISGSAHSALALNVEMASNPRAAPSERAVALCWIFHIVGDIHQPLHTAELFARQFPTGDQGGGLAYVVEPNSTEPEIFHWYWDDLVHRSGEPQTVFARARQLEQSLPRASFKELSVDPAHVADSVAWAAESYVLASSLAYRAELAAAPGQAKPLSADYVAQTTAAAERRVTLSGYRLADLLRHIFSSTSLTQP
jgi:hypothetical protein